MSLNSLTKELLAKRVSSQTKKFKTNVSTLSHNKKELSSINNSILLIQEKIKNLKLIANRAPKIQLKREEMSKQLYKEFNLKSQTKAKNTNVSSFSNGKIKNTDLMKTPRLSQNNSKIGSKKNSVEKEKKTPGNDMNKTERVLKNRSIEINLSLPLKNAITPINFYGKKDKLAPIKKTNLLTNSKLGPKINCSLDKYPLKRDFLIKDKLNSDKKKLTSFDWSQFKSLSERENKMDSIKKKGSANRKNKSTNLQNLSKNSKLGIQSIYTKKTDNKVLIKPSKLIKNKNVSNTSLNLKEDFFNIKKDDECSNISTSNITTNYSTKPMKKIRQIYEISRTGLARNNQKKTNQDSSFILKNFCLGEDSIFMGVCDGHGPIGHEISKLLKERLPVFLNSEIDKRYVQNGSTALKKIVEETFLEMNDEIFLEMTIDSEFRYINNHPSGSTCCSLIYTPEKLICANVGDSRCIIGRQVNDEWKFHSMSRDHKPNDKDESERILSKNGRIEPYQDTDGEFVGPMRVWIKEDSIPGLAMSRSFGDKIASMVGVVALPEIKEWNFTKEDKFIIIASDGIWEFINNQECVDIVKDYYINNDIVGASEFLVEEATRYWIKEDTIIDDITVIVVFLDN